MPFVDVHGADAFRDVVNDTTLTVVWFTAVWCSACRGIDRDLQKLTYDYRQVRFARVDADDNADIVERCRIAQLPTFMLVQNGSMLGYVIGADVAENADRLNRMQIREQQLLNRERRRQLEAETQAQQRALQSTKAQYSHVSSHGYGARSSNNNNSRSSLGNGGSGDAAAAAVAQRRVSQGGRASASPLSGSSSSHTVGKSGGDVADDVEIRVYVRECDGDKAQQLRYRESDSEVHVTATAHAPRGVVAGANIRASRATASAVVASGSGGDVRNRQRGMQSRGSHNNNSNDEDDNEDDRGVVACGDRGAVAPVPSSPSETGARGRRFGHVPRYLQQRKAELQAEAAALQSAAAQRREQAKLPPGHRLVAEDEKHDTVAALEARRGELERQLGKLPIRYDTQSIQQRRRGIEEELCDIDVQVNKYRTTRTLYVPVDECVLQRLTQPQALAPPPPPSSSSSHTW